MLHTFLLEKSNYFVPVLNFKLMRVLVVRVEAFDDDCEWFDAYLAKRVVLIEAALNIASADI